MENVDVLNEVHKGAKMGMDSINMVVEKVGDVKFRDLLVKQYNEYKTILDQSTQLLGQENRLPEDNNMPQKMMTWVGIQMNTINDKSNAQLSDLLVQGTNMGIIKGVQLLNHNPELGEPVKNLVSDFVRLQERNVDDLKKFL